MGDKTEEFVTLLTSSQGPLFACILALVADRTAAHDVLQETNITLWRKFDDFEEGTNFLAWASRIARYHVANYRRKTRRDKLVFDEALFNELCNKQAARIEELDRTSGHLQHCLKKLPPQHYDLIVERYSPGGSVKQAALKRQQSPGAVSQLLYRIRESLLNCVSKQIEAG